MKKLVVCVPGLGQHCDKWKPLLASVVLPSGDTHVLLHNHGGTLWSRRSASALASDLASDIETAWTVHGPFEDVILLAHSMGALLTRQAYLEGLARAGAPAKPWTQHVSRVVLFAGVNRGIELKRNLRWVVLLIFWRAQLIRDILSGSDFVTNLRIWWIRKLAEAEKRPIVIQVRGDADNVIRKEDSIDVEGFLEGHELFVSGAGHADMILPDLGEEFSDEKLKRLKYSLYGAFPDEESRDREESADHKVIFVVHGIRDSSSDWVKDLSTSIADIVPGAEVVSPTFGRFSALKFAIPPIRRSRVRWFQDVYSMKLSRNPLAKFYFVGHSYGTYLLGHGLENLPGMTFDRVLLAGSVLPETLNWAKLAGQVTELRNCRAQYDAPVAILCPALRGIGLGKGIGTAGYTGFFIPFSQKSEQAFYQGGHDATISTVQARKDVLGFVEKGDAYKPQSELVSEDKKFSLLSAASGSVGYVLLLLCLLVAGLLTLATDERTLSHFFVVAAEVLVFALLLAIGILAYV